jgi:hypothetical protein
MNRVFFSVVNYKFQLRTGRLTSGHLNSSIAKNLSIQQKNVEGLVNGFADLIIV